MELPSIRGSDLVIVWGVHTSALGPHFYQNNTEHHKTLGADIWHRICGISLGSPLIRRRVRLFVRILFFVTLEK